MDWAELISQINWASVAGNTISGTGILILSWLGIHFRRAIFRAMLYLWARARAAAIAAGQWLRLITHCRSIAIKNANLQSTIAHMESELAQLREQLQLQTDEREQTTRKHILQFLEYTECPTLAIDRTIESWHESYRRSIVYTCTESGLLTQGGRLTQKGRLLLISSGIIPTPE